MKIIINWFLFLSLIAAPIVVFLRRQWIIDNLPTVPRMTGLQVIVFALSGAFTWVEVLRWGHTKPFNCIKCLTGWFALILAFSHHVEFWPLYLPLGLFVGAMFEGIKMRWL